MLAISMSTTHSDLDCALTIGLIVSSSSYPFQNPCDVCLLSSRAVLAIHADSTLQLALVPLGDSLFEEGYAM